MSREDYLALAREGLCMPIAADMALHAHDDPAAIMLDGPRLGAVMAEAARRFDCPLAVALMDLAVEKSAILEILGVAEAERDKYHFTAPVAGELVASMRASLDAAPSARMAANAEALAYLVDHEPDLTPVGMAIGPFSLMTKLMDDPITAVFLAGMGTGGDEEPAVALAENMIALGTEAILASVDQQVRAGAKAVFLCEPAANAVYLSPKQIEAGSDVFERFVMAPNRLIRDFLAERGADLIFHDCGELPPSYVRMLAGLRPEVLSLGSPVSLPEIAAEVPDDVVLFGNLPSKRFFSDADLPVDELRAMTRELVDAMHAAGHPFILATECDVLSVPGATETILRKVDAFLAEGRCVARA